MKRFAAFILGTVLGTAVLSAQTFLSVNSASEAAALATGGTGWSSAAALSLEGGKAEAGFDYMSLAPESVGTSVFNADAAVGMKRLELTIRYRSFAEKSVSFTDADGALTDSFRPRENLVGIGAAWKFNGSIAAGAEIEGIDVRYSSDLEASAIAANLFAACRINGISAELSLNHIGNKLYFGQGEAQSLPAMLRLNGEYLTHFGLKALAEAGFILAGGFEAGIGAEYVYDGIAVLRAGWHYGNSILAIQNYLSVGAGIILGGLSVDFAFLPVSETLGNSLMIGIRYGF